MYWLDGIKMYNKFLSYQSFDKNGFNNKEANKNILFNIYDDVCGKYIVMDLNDLFSYLENGGKVIGADFNETSVLDCSIWDMYDRSLADILDLEKVVYSLPVCYASYRSIGYNSSFGIRYIYNDGLYLESSTFGGSSQLPLRDVLSVVRRVNNILMGSFEGELRWNSYYLFLKIEAVKGVCWLRFKYDKNKFMAHIAKLKILNLINESYIAQQGVSTS